MTKTNIANDGVEQSGVCRPQRSRSVHILPRRGCKRGELHFSTTEWKVEGLMRNLMESLGHHLDNKLGKHILCSTRTRRSQRTFLAMYYLRLRQLLRRSAPVTVSRHRHTTRRKWQAYLEASTSNVRQTPFPLAGINKQQLRQSSSPNFYLVGPPPVTLRYAAPCPKSRLEVIRFTRTYWGLSNENRTACEAAGSSALSCYS